MSKKQNILDIAIKELDGKQTKPDWPMFNRLLDLELINGLIKVCLRDLKRRKLRPDDLDTTLTKEKLRQLRKDKKRLEKEIREWKYDGK